MTKLGDYNVMNLNNHPLKMVTESGDSITIPPSGTVARVNYSDTTVNMVGDIPVIVPVYGEILGLPEPKENVLYIVSAVVRNALGNGTRPDVLCAHNIEKDGRGKPKYARALRQAI
jgi:hypothetical protein